jgi:hypothetical protein
VRNDSHIANIMPEMLYYSLCHFYSFIYTSTSKSACPPA